MDPELLAVKDSLIKVLEAQASATKDSLGLMARRQLLEEKAIKQLAQELNVGEEKIKQELAGLKQQKETTEAQKTFTDGLKRGAQQAVDTLFDFVKGSAAASQSMYHTTEVFTSVIPTLQTMGNAVKGVIGALGSAFSGIPIIGGFLDASAKMVGAAVSFAVTLAENQLKNSQTMVNNFSAIAKTGTTFGASLDGMIKAAHDGGMSLSMFQSFVTKNVETLGQLGGSTEQASRRVVNLAKDVAAANPKLLAMAGGMEGVANQTIEYMGAMTRMGFDTTKSNKNQAQAAADYIWNLNTLSALTGESADKLKKEQDERLRSAGYLLKLNEMGPEAAQSMQNGISQAASKLGPNFAKFAEEFVATGGRVVSESALQYQAQNQEIARNLMPQLVENSMLGGKAAATANAELLTKMTPAIEAEMMRYAGLMKAGLAYADASDGWIKGINENMSFFMRNKAGLLGMSEAAKSIEQQRDAKVGAEIEQYAKNIISLTDFQIVMDDLTKRTLPDMGKLVNSLIAIQTRMQQNMIPMIEASVKHISDFVDKLEEKLGINQPIQTNTATINAAGGTTVINGGGSVVQTGRGTSHGGTNGTASGGTRGQATRLSSSASGTNTSTGSNGTGSSNSTGSTASQSEIELTTVSSKSGVSARVGKQYANSFQSLIDYLDSVNYEIKTLGGYNNRDVTGQPGVKSAHAFGAAIDINEDTNPYGTKLVTDLPAQIGDKAKELGLGWGGDWPNIKDAMHFSAQDSEGGTIKLMKSGGITNGVSIAGEAGPEAVIPLPDGRSIPVTLDISSMVRILEEVRDGIAESNSRLDSIFSATVG